MKGLILENEYRVDEQVVKFIAANPNLFTETTELICCLKRNMPDMVSEILANDAIILASTFMYLDQLRDFLTGFLTPQMPNKIFFVNDITSRLNNWKYSDSILLREEELFEAVRKMLAKGHTLYSYEGHGNHKGEHPYSKVLYSDVHGVFYNEDDSEGYGLDMFKKNLY
jgi:hypothetical protein